MIKFFIQDAEKCWHVYQKSQIDFPSYKTFFVSACNRVIFIPTETTATEPESTCGECKKNVGRAYVEFKENQKGDLDGRY